MTINLTQIEINTALLSGRKINGTLTYSIPWNESVWPGYSENSQPYTDYSPPTSIHMDITTAVAYWEMLIDLPTQYVSDDASGSGQMRFGFTSYDMNGFSGYVFLTDQSNPIDADIWISNRFINDEHGMFETLLHEIGHVLGLKHPFESPVISSEYDSTQYTIMSYTDPQASVMWRFYAEDNFVKANGYTVTNRTPMILDIAAIQSLYGRNQSYESGDTLYRFTQDDSSRGTIYDAGGVDTFDFFDFKRPVHIDLNPGTYSSIGIYSIQDQIDDAKKLIPGVSEEFLSSVLNDPTTYRFTENLGIAFSTIIENARGGSADDRLIGNSAENKLYGGDGLDDLFGQDGNDILNGNAGNDTVVGGHGNDTLYGEDGVDALFGEFGDDVLIGGIGEDRLYGQDGSDVLFGELDNDLLIAGHGNDRLYGQDGNDTLFGEFGSDQIVGGSGGDYAYGQNGNDLLFGEAGDDLLFGGVDDDRLYGQAGNDTLDGGEGIDILEGGAGDDFLIGGPEADQLSGGTGADFFFFSDRTQESDYVFDFSQSQGDKLIFQAQNFNIPTGFTLTSGIGLLMGTASVASTATFYFDASSKALWFDVDGIGSSGANVIAFLLNAPTLTANDFLFI